MADGWKFALEQLEVLNADEDDFWSDGDEPYFVTIGFRSKFMTAGSTHVFWSSHLDDEWAEGIEGGGKKAIPPAMGVVKFDGVERPNLAALKGGARPEVLGALVVAFESDATPFGVIRDKMNEVKGEIHNQLVKLVEKGQIDPNNPNPAIQKAIAEIREKMTPSVGEAISIWLQSFGDPDDLIGIQVAPFAAIDPSIQGAIALPALTEQNLTRDFKADGVHYRVHGRVLMQPRIVSPRCPQGAYVGAVSRSQDHLDVFSTDAHGVIRTAAWQPAFTDGWRGWWEIRGGRAAAGAPVIGTSRSANKLDVFAIGTDNRVYTAAWEPAFTDGWHGWWNLRNGVAVPGAPVTVVSRSADKLDVFAVGTDGHVYTAAWEPAFTDGWHGWWRIGDVKAPPGSYVGAVSRSKDHLDIFVTDVNGNTMTAAWSPTSKGWQGWWHIRGGKAKPGAPITAVSRSANKLDVFVVGTDGHVYTAAWEPAFTDGWHGWWRIRDAKAPQGGFVGAVCRSTDKLDVFVTDVNGNTLTAAWEPAFTDGWHGWWHIRGGKAKPGAPITAVSRSANKLDVFVVGTDGRVWTAAWEPAFTDGWHGWWPIGA